MQLSWLACTSLLWTLVLASCLSDREFDPEESICEITKTREQSRVLGNLGLQTRTGLTHENCAIPRVFSVSSPFSGIPDVAVEPPLQVFRVHRLRFIEQSLALDAPYPCGQDSEQHVVICSQTPAETPSQVHVVIYETSHPLPFRSETDHYELSFSFDSDLQSGNNYTPPDSPPVDDSQPGSYFRNADRWYRAQLRPGSAWTLDVFAVVSNTPTLATSGARIIMDGTTIALVVPTDEFDSIRPTLRIHLFRHQGDFGLGTPENWSAFVFPGPFQGLFSADR